MSTISELLDYEYGLNPESIVIDAGAYTGQWAEAVAKRYGCRIYSFEPVLEFYQEAASRLLSFPGVKIQNAALGVESSQIEIGLANNSSGAYADGEKRLVRSLSIVTMIRDLGNIAMAKINCEGMEYELLETILNFGLIGQIRALQVQFHWNAPSATLRWSAIDERLRATHRIVMNTAEYWSIWVKNI